MTRSAEIMWVVAYRGSRKNQLSFKTAGLNHHRGDCLTLITQDLPPLEGQKCSTAVGKSAPSSIKLVCRKEEEEEEEVKVGVSLETMSPDRINYSDVSICQQLWGARRGELGLRSNRKQQGTNGRILIRKGWGEGRNAAGGGGGNESRNRTVRKGERCEDTPGAAELISWSKLILSFLFFTSLNSSHSIPHSSFFNTSTVKEVVNAHKEKLYARQQFVAALIGCPHSFSSPKNSLANDVAQKWSHDHVWDNYRVFIENWEDIWVWLFLWASNDDQSLISSSVSVRKDHW